MNKKSEFHLSSRTSVCLFALGLILLSLIVFRVVLDPDVVLFSTDDDIGHIAARKAILPRGFIGCIEDSPLLGIAATFSLNLTSILVWILPVEFFSSHIHTIDLLLASFFFAAFLRMRKIGWLACVIGVLTAFWLGTNLTLAYAGHVGKFGVLVFCAMALWLIEKTVQTQKPGWSLLAGGAVGGMFLEQQDVALFFGIPLGAYAVLSVVRAEGWHFRPLVSRLLPIAAIALLIAGPTMIRAYVQNVKGAAIVSETADPKAKWEFCTQWSVPPNESIDFIAPGFTGWRSHDPEGPYIGKTGRSAGWEQTKQGFRNFRLESIYIGAIPITLAVFALFMTLLVREKTWHGRSDVIFWGSIAVVALLLSFGKYFPLYRLFYQLPLISSIRNPNKFVQVFQVAVAILSAYGLDLAFQKSAPTERAESSAWRIRVFVIVVAVIGIFLLLGSVSLASSRSFQEQRFITDGWGTAAPLIVGNMIVALAHSGVLTLLCAVGLWVLCIPRMENKQMFRNTVVCILIALVVVDLLMLSRHYIKPANVKATVGENIVVKFLKENLDHQRVLTLNQSGFYNNWLSVLFPYHDIAAFNVTQMPRMPQDYKRFLSAVGKNPVRMWQLSSIGYVLAPAQLWAGIQRDPNMTKLFEPAMGFNVFAVKNGIAVERPTGMHPAQHFVLRFKKGMPRYALIGNWEIVPDDTALAMLAGPTFDPEAKVLIAPNGAEDLPVPLSQSSGVSSRGSVKVLKYEAVGKVTLAVSATASCILLASERYTPGWKVTVDGRKSRLLRSNYICQGVFLEKGEHEVVLEYAPGAGWLWVQGLGMLMCLGAAVQVALTKRNT